MLAAVLAVLATAAPAVPIAPQRPVHLGFVFKLTHQAELDALRAAQQDPRSPDFRRWLTPAEFGRRFGQSEALIAQTEGWLRSHGFEVTVYPNRSFVEAIGTAAQANDLLGVRLLAVQGRSPAVHVPAKAPVLPAWLAQPLVLISGLDTRPRAHHRLYDSTNTPALGPQDLRAQYDVAAVLDAGFYGQGQQLVVLSEAEAPGNEVQAIDIAYFFNSVSDARAVFTENVLANPDGDFDSEPDGRLEFELDPEMQSVGAPGAASITLEVAPASQVFTLGTQDIANSFASATAVSVSLGECEAQETAGGDQEALAMRQAVIQGTTEGQTWSAASGDNGADDCLVGQGGATVDFPAVIPEIVAVGGSQIDPVTFDQNAAITAFQTEEVWNDFEIFGGDAAGGGISTLYSAPSYQSAFAFTGRSVPDLSLIAGGPYTIAVTTRPGEFDSIEGTSIASPLSAGFFALIASGLGCRLGDPHQVLYDLGAAQQDGGGASVFNDIVSGDNSADGVVGYTAGVGFDSASGWGSMDVAALLRAWPACAPDAGSTPGTSGPSYSQCAFIGCDAGCANLPEGPSICSFEVCDPNDGGGCSPGLICSGNGPYAAADDAGACLLGCYTDTDCIDGGVCDLCFNFCVPTGTSSAHLGDPCASPDDCPAGSTCLLYTGYFDGGYCSAPCDPNSSKAACACPAGSTCYGFETTSGDFLDTCLGDCDDGGCDRPGYVCQPEGPGYRSCLPACTDDGFDTCFIYSASNTSCDVPSGVCQYPTGTSTGGGTTGTSSGGGLSGTTSAGSSTGGASSTGTSSGGSSTGTSTGTASSSGSSTGRIETTTTGGMPILGTRSSGCNCSTGGSPDVVLGFFAMLGLARRRRRTDQSHAIA